MSIPSKIPNIDDLTHQLRNFEAKDKQSQQVGVHLYTPEMDPGDLSLFNMDYVVASHYKFVLGITFRDDFVHESSEPFTYCSEYIYIYNLPCLCTYNLSFILMNNLPFSEEIHYSLVWTPPVLVNIHKIPTQLVIRQHFEGN